MEGSLGANLQFLSEPLPDYFCPVCTEALTEPYLTDCGHHFCYTCRRRLTARGKPDCPECREQNALTDARLNKHLQRQVNSLKVHCQHHEVGCQWVGELRYLQEHLDPVIRKCGFILLACPLGCGESVCSSAMKDHLLTDCSKRSCECEHCGYCNTFDIVTEQHYPVCEQFPVECPNACSGVTMKRQELASHLEEQCPLQVIQCPFTSAGCTVQLTRREMEEHEKIAVHQHLRMMMSMMQLKEPPASGIVATTAKQLENVFNFPPLEFTITDFMKKKECNAEWISPVFYSHPDGYKLCLVVYPNGTSVGKGTHVSIYVGFLNEIHVSKENWHAVDFDIYIHVLNWRKDEGHHEESLSYIGIGYRTSREGIKLSSRRSSFIPHASLSYNTTTNTEYLQNECVRLRVSKVILYSTALLNKTPSWQNPQNGYQSLHEFTLTDLSKRKQFNNCYCSAPFYTHHHGYKLCLVVYSNGDGSGKDMHVSVFLSLMAGEYDDQLVWPFASNFDIELLNWRNNAMHCKQILQFGDNNQPHKVPKEDIYGLTWGYSQFIPHSSLAYDSTSNVEYLQEDCLRFRVSMSTT